MAGFEEEFLRIGHTSGTNDASERAELTGRNLGNVPAPSAPAMATTSALPRAEVEHNVGVDSEITGLERACFQGVTGDTQSIPSNEYPLRDGSNLEKGKNAVTFQKQLADIDSELAKFEVEMGPSTLVTNGPSARLIDGPSLANSPALTYGLTKTPSRQQVKVRNQIVFFDRLQ